MSVAAGEDRGRARAVFFVYATVTLLLCLLAAYVYVRRGPIHSLLGLPFYVGETSWNLIRGLGLSFRTYPVPAHMVWMHGARMPVVTLYVTAATLYLGPSQMLLATLIKTALLLQPVLGAARTVLYRSEESGESPALSASILALPLLVPAFLSDAINLQAEEGFSYAFLALAFTLIACGMRRDPKDVPSVLVYTVATAAALDMLYLSKSSMILAISVLTIFFLLRQGPVWSRTLLLVLVAAAPMGWAIRQHAASGRYAVGTSYDGGNLHKGNSEQFAAHYPPRDGESLDAYDSQIQPPEALGDEWSYNDWHERAAIHYIRTHPKETLSGWKAKAYVFLVSLHVYGNGPVALPQWAVLIGMVWFRMLLWGGILCSVYVAVRLDGQPRTVALLYLMTVAACTVPYLAGFGYTRHASVLVYPSAVVLCLLYPAVLRKPQHPG